VKQWIISLLMMLSVPATVAAEAAELQDLRELYQWVEPGAIVIIEIDNVLLEPAQQLGSVQWLEYEVREKVAYGLSWPQAYRSLLPVWHRVLARTEVRPCSPLVPGAVRGLQRQGVVVMGMSSREIDVAAITLEQLHAISVHFWPAQSDFDGLEGFCNSPTKYVGGVLFCGHRNMPGRALLDWMTRTSLRPSKVVYVADNWVKVRDVEEAMTSIDVPVVGVRYSGSDEKAFWYEPQVARTQLRCFDTVLSNEAADKLVQRRGFFWWLF